MGYLTIDTRLNGVVAETRRAVEARAAYGIHFFDGMIVAAPERSGCEKILSEDLNSQQKYFGVAVANPFH
jgi:predicted nucleic acid-binding protein